MADGLAPSKLVEAAGIDMRPVLDVIGRFWTAA